MPKARHLLLLRHAEALPAPADGRDQDRPLSAHGQGQAEQVAHKLLELGLEVDLILCSSARRTRDTAARIHHRYPDARCERLDRLYNADPKTLRAVLAEHGGGARCVLLVAHNPGISQLADQLGALHGGAGLPTAGLRVISQPADGSWQELHGSEPA